MFEGRVKKILTFLKEKLTDETESSRVMLKTYSEYLQFAPIGFHSYKSKLPYLYPSYDYCHPLKQDRKLNLIYPSSKSFFPPFFSISRV